MTQISGTRTVASSLEEHVDDHNELHRLHNVADSAWTPYTPTLGQGAAVTTSSLSGRFKQIGSTVVGSVRAVISGGGTSGNSLVVLLPVTPYDSSLGLVVGSFSYYDSSASLWYAGAAVMLSLTQVRFQYSGAADVIGAVAPAQVGVNDILSFTFAYEAA